MQDTFKADILRDSVGFFREVIQVDSDTDESSGGEESETAGGKAPEAGEGSKKATE